MKNFLRTLMFLLVLQVTYSLKSFGYSVTQLTALYQNGQVFLTWQNPTTTNLQYNLYRSSVPITTSSQLTSSTYLGYVRDNSAENVRKTGLSVGITVYYVITSGQSPLASDRGLYVATCATNGTEYYAVTVTTLSNSSEDKTVNPGSNSLITGIAETVAVPKPVLQTITAQVNGDMSSEYVIWGDNQELPHWRAFNNLGSYGYNFSVQTRGSYLNQPLYVDFQDANPFSRLDSTFCSNCNMLQLDDRLPNGQGTYWIGYNDSYNMYVDNNSNPIVTTGIMHTYSQAVAQSIIRWTKRQAGIDSNRIYMTGQSHNGFGCMLTAFNMSTEIASIYVLGAPILIKTKAGDDREHYMCSSAANIPTDINFPGTTTPMLIWDFCNMRTYYRVNNVLPFTQGINGKNDITVGWIEKFHWYDTVNVSKQGGIWFWDQRDHAGNGAQYSSAETTPAWTRYASNRSYPAFSSCSINQNPGTGATPASGDPYGAINGYLDWNDNSMSDQACSYSFNCFVKNFYLGGVLVANQYDSCTADITLRRPQQFHPTAGQTITWTNYGVNNHLLQSGSFVYSGGPVTLFGIKIKKTGSTITLSAPCTPLITYYADADGDGFGNPNVTTQAYSSPPGYVTNSTDCNDANANVRPNATEVCNGIDDNCNGQIDEGVKLTFYADADGDGYGNIGAITQACSAPAGYISNNTDCNDANVNIHPNATEICNGIDDNCNGQIDEGVKLTFYADADGDGYGNLGVTTLACSAPGGYVSNSTDCDDLNASVHPNAIETVNGIDDNCNGLIDDVVLLTYYADADGDGYGNASASSQGYTLPSGYVFDATDCNDTNASIHPNVTEVCNGVDDNCNGQIDEGVKITFYADADGDTYGNSSVNTQACSAPIGYVTNNTDCNDANAAIHIGVAEVCNGIDDNCDGQIDEGVKITFYADADGDSYGNANVNTQACSAPLGYILNNTDCNDANAAVHPGVAEVCNSVDDNCNGQIDEGVKTTFYADADGDSYGNPNSSTLACSLPNGYVINSADCNDANPAIRPGATEVCNSIDDNCNGLIDEGIVTSTITPSGNVNICSGNSIALQANTGAGLIYQWKKNGAAISGATTSSYTVMLAGTYTVTVTSGTCALTSAPAIVNVVTMPVPVVTTSTGATTFCSNSGVYLTTTTTGYNYSWIKGSNAQVGATNQNYIPPSSATYKVQIIDVNGCTSNSNGLAVTVNNAPIPAITGSSTICPGQSTSLSASATYSSYSWSTGATAQSISVSATAAYSLTVTDANGCSGSATQTETAGSTPAPVITAAGPTQFCSGSVDLNVTSTFSTYTWSNVKFTPTITVTSSGTYNCTVTNTQGCSGISNSITVNAHELPTPTIITSTGATTFCSNSGVYLTSTTNGYNYAWFKGSTAQAGATNQNYTPPLSATYKVQIIDAFGCTSSSAGLGVTVNAAPIPTITGSSTICQGQSTSLSANTTYSSYTWSTGVHTQSISVSTANTYTLTVTDANGCSGSATKVISYGAALTPTITASGPIEFCSGSVDLSVTTTYSQYLWSNAKNGQTITATTSATYSCTVTDAAGCTATSNSITVKAHELPTPSIATSSGPTTFCSNSGVYLTTTTAGYNYAWFKGATLQTGATAQNYTPSSSATYKVQIIDAFGCTSSSNGLAVTVNNAPAPTITGSAAICGTHTTTLSANTTYPHYTWSTGAITQSITTSSAATYTLTVTDANNCTGTSPSVATTVYTPPTPTISASPGTDFCDGSSVTLTATSAISYSWSNGKTTQTNTVSTSGSFTVTITDVHGCTGISAPITTNDHILPVPTVTAVGPTTYCLGSPASYLTTSSNGYSYVWKLGTTTVAGATGQNYEPVSNGTYKVQISDNIGCTKLASVGKKVTVNVLPTVSISATGSLNLCGGATKVITATATGTGISYKWQKNSLDISGAVSASYTASLAGTYTCIVTNSKSCTATSNSIVITSNCKLEDGESANDGLQTTMKLYPNPALNNIHVDAQFGSQLNGEALLEIRNLLGEVIYTEKQEIEGGKFSSTILFDQRFSDGSYLARICFNNDCIVKQFLITGSGK